MVLIQILYYSPIYYSQLSTQLTIMFSSISQSELNSNYLKFYSMIIFINRNNIIIVAKLIIIYIYVKIIIFIIIYFNYLLKQFDVIKYPYTIHSSYIFYYYNLTFLTLFFLYFIKFYKIFLFSFN